MKAFFISPPKYIKFSPTMRCNLRCVMCDAYDQKSSEMSLSDIASLVRVIERSYCFRKKPRIRITGGEPFVRKDIMEILCLFAQKKFPVDINTNGTLLEPYLDQLEDTTVESISLSVDGVSARTHDAIRGVSGSFDKMMSVFHGLRKKYLHRITIDIICVLQKDNIDEAKEIALWAQKQSVPISFQLPRTLRPKDAAQVEQSWIFWKQGMDHELVDKICVFKKWVNEHENCIKVKIAPFLSDEGIKNYFGLISTLLPRDCSSLRDILRIAPDGGVYTCFAMKPISCDWNKISHVNDAACLPRLVSMPGDYIKHGFPTYCTGCCKAVY